MPVAEGFTTTSMRIPDDLKLWLEGEAQKEFGSVNRLVWMILDQERERRQQAEN